MMKPRPYSKKTVRSARTNTVMHGSIVAGFFLLVFVPLMLRATSGAPLLTNPESYLVLMAREGSAVLPFNLFTFLSSFVSTDFILFGNIFLVLASLALLSFILGDYGSSKRIRWVALSLFALSPTVLLAASSLTIAPLVVFLILACFLSFKRNSFYQVLFSLLLFLTSPFSWFLTTIIQSTLPERTNRLWQFLSFVGLVSILLGKFLSWNLGEGPFPSIVPMADLGLGVGYSVFLLVLAAIGLFVSWPALPRITHWPLLILLLFAPFNPILLFVISLPLVVLGAFGFNVLIKRQWGFSWLKDACILLVSCGLIFSTFASVADSVRSEPSPELVGVLGSVRDFNQGIIVAPQDLSYFVPFFSGKDLYYDLANPRSFGDDRFYDELLASSRFDDAQSLINLTDSQYVYILLTDLSLSSQREGLAFLVENNDKFIEVARAETAELWLHIKQE